VRKRRDSSGETIFMHPHLVAWHNNAPPPETSQRRSCRTRRLFNTRCHYKPGCPEWLHLDCPDSELDTHRKMEENLSLPQSGRSYIQEHHYPIRFPSRVALNLLSLGTGFKQTCRANIFDTDNGYLTRL